MGDAPPSQFRSSLDEGLEDEGHTPFERPVRQIKRCPNYCQVFECVTDEDCREECRRLDTIGGSICDLCKHDNTCTPKRKMALLGLEYIEKSRSKKAKEASDNIEKVKKIHYHLEQSYTAMQTKYLTIPFFNFANKNQLQAEGQATRQKLEHLREFMDILSIPYEEEVKLEKVVEKNNNNLITILLVAGLVIVYLAVSL